MKHAANRKMNIFAGLILFAGICFARASDFPFEYVPNQLPTESEPRWHLWKSENCSGKISIVDKFLRYEGPGNERFAYMVGTFDNDKKAGSGAEAWQVSNGVATVDFRFKCNADKKSTEEIFYVSLSDGASTWLVSFSPTTVKSVGKTRPVDTTKMDTYRLTLSGGTLQISCARLGTLLESHAGMTGDKISNRLLFGTMGGKKNQSVPVSWDFAFIRWTTDHAFSDRPPAQ